MNDLVTILRTVFDCQRQNQGLRQVTTDDRSTLPAIFSQSVRTIVVIPILKSMATILMLGNTKVPPNLQLLLLHNFSELV